jgi:hypothetical protein
MTTFHKATKSKARLRMAIPGPAGSGKTYTALSIARHLGQRVAVIDTEHGSAAKYADLFDFDTATLDSFSIDNYISTIKMAEQAGYDVLIIDSLSHAWTGKDGALEEVERLRRSSKSGNAYTAGWGEVTPKQNKLIDAILATPMHVIATLRTKTAYEMETVNGKITPRKVGTEPIQRQGVDYEFDVVGEMDPDHLMRITKTRCPVLTDKAFDKPGQDVAAILNAWLNDGAPAPTPPPAPQPTKRPAILDTPAPDMPAENGNVPTDLPATAADLVRLVDAHREQHGKAGFSSEGDKMLFVTQQIVKAEGLPAFQWGMLKDTAIRAQVYQILMAHDRKAEKQLA